MVYKRQWVVGASRTFSDMAKAIASLVLLIIGVALGAAPRRPNPPGNWKPYIIGGEVVQGRKYPGQISLQVSDSHNCGGSIVNQNYIVTAAHCSQYSPNELEVLSGTNSLVQGGIRHKVTEIHYHEKYDPQHSWHNDVAVMKVDPPFVFDEDTAPVTLAAQGQVTEAGTTATVIGWGATSYGGELSNDLLEVDILISDHDKCNATYAGEGYVVYPEQICADTPEGNKGSCNGDSGGPLFVKGQVVGLVSWARGCDIKGYPTVYTQVSSYRDWIDSKVQG